MPEDRIQESTLELLKEKKIIVKIYLVNGVQINGLIKAFDPYVVVVEDEKQQSIIYKHAISTVIPSQNPYSESNHVESKTDVK
ncbi:MAG: RNA chaperone Hfq [Mesoaciditoga sp.]|nr:MAG: RNA chaperone Hfq [Mesoaciditoga sp.]